MRVNQYRYTRHAETLNNWDDTPLILAAAYYFQVVHRRPINDEKYHGVRSDAEEPRRKDYREQHIPGTLFGRPAYVWISPYWEFTTKRKPVKDQRYCPKYMKMPGRRGLILLGQPEDLIVENT